MGNRDTKTTQSHLWGLMPEPVPRRSVETVRSSVQVRKVLTYVRVRDKLRNQP